MIERGYRARCACVGGDEKVLPREKKV